MYGVSLLKPRLERSADGLVCPVRGCRHHVPVQPQVFRLSPEYVCPVHKIAISEATFAYERESDNLLWSDAESLRLLNASKPPGRDERIGFDNSERALTWNVFRWLETTGVLGDMLERWTGGLMVAPSVVYWSYSSARDGVDLSLMRARSAYDEEDGEETEPAVLVTTDDLVVFVDPHLGSAVAAPRNPSGSERYQAGGRGWAADVVEGPCRDFAADRGEFELLRLWLIGSFLAQQVEKRFVLLYVAPSWSRGTSFAAASARFRQGPDRQALRVDWEQIYRAVAAEHVAAPGALALLTYLEQKAAGYGADGVLRRAFRLEAPGRT
jgi:hypothetical protein